MSEISFNLFSNRFNSSIGVLVNQHSYHQGGFESRQASIQYGYRVLFLEKFFWNIGVGLSYQDLSADLNNFHYEFAPKFSYTLVPPEIINSESVKASYGIILHQAQNKFYVGFSFRDQHLTSLNKTSEKYIRRDPTFSFQGMYSLPITRKMSLFAFASYERIGKLRSFQDSEKTLQEEFSYLFLQANLVTRKMILGTGYKIFFSNYGSMHFRLGILPGKKKRTTIGYSYDMKPFIQYDRIHIIPSHEFYIKRKFTYKQ
jgi:hypothetical protein